MKFLFWKNAGIKVLILVVVLVIFTMITIGIYFGKVQDKKTLKVKFNGRVDSIWYPNGVNDLHGVTEPKVIIEGKTYYLYYHSWDFGLKIQKGDSLIKKENTFIVTLVKKNGRVFEYGEN